MVIKDFYNLTGHGRLWDPPSRSTAWRQGFNTPINYNDNELFCGGFSVSLRKYPFQKSKQGEVRLMICPLAQTLFTENVS